MMDKNKTKQVDKETKDEGLEERVSTLEKSLKETAQILSELASVKLSMTQLTNRSVEVRQDVSAFAQKTADAVVDLQLQINKIEDRHQTSLETMGYSVGTLLTTDPPEEVSKRLNTQIIVRQQ